jgi:hypothetical protein
MNIVGTIKRSDLISATVAATSDPILIEAAENQKYYAHEQFFNGECGCVVGAALIREGYVEPENIYPEAGRITLTSPDFPHPKWHGIGIDIYYTLRDMDYVTEGTYKVLDD